MSKSHFKDVTGQRSGYWEAQRYLKPQPGWKGGARWQCCCHRCGFERTMTGNQFRHHPPVCPECCKRAASGSAWSKKRRDRVRELAEDLRTVRAIVSPKAFSRPEVDTAPPATVVPFDDSAERYGTPHRCSVCRSVAVFIRARCGNCGSAWSADLLPHVDGTRVTDREDGRKCA